MLENLQFYIDCHFIRALNQVVTTRPTIGCNYEEVKWKNTKLQVWDLGGQESIRASWKTYFTDTNVIFKRL